MEKEPKINSDNRKVNFTDESHMFEEYKELAKELTDSYIEEALNSKHILKDVEYNGQELINGGLDNGTKN